MSQDKPPKFAAKHDWYQLKQIHYSRGYMCADTALCCVRDVTQYWTKKRTRQAREPFTQEMLIVWVFVCVCYRQLIDTIHMQLHSKP